MTAALSNLDRLQEEVFEGVSIKWVVSPKLGPDLPYTETQEAWYFNKRGTDRIYVQLKSLGDSLTTCFECEGNVAIKPQTVNMWGDDLGPCAVAETKIGEAKYCPNCEEEPESSRIEVRK